MNISLDTQVQYLNGVGPKMAARLNKLGIETVRDLLFNFPRRYLDYTSITSISQISQALGGGHSGIFTIKGTILAIANKKTRRRGFTVTEAVVTDDSGSIKVVWFNQPFLGRMLAAGSWVILSGKISYDSFSNGLVMESPTRSSRPQILPVYPETVGISSFYINKLVASSKDQVARIEEWLPAKLVSLSAGKLVSSKLMTIQQAILSIHFPKSTEELAEAQRRLAFDELFMIALRANIGKAESEKQKAKSIKTDIPKLKDFIGKLPYKLTDDQKKALWQIVQDMEKETPMRRLLNGDVGSGKTIVAALAAYVACEQGFKTILMAPTEILANQHYETFCGLFPKEQIGLLTSNKKQTTSDSKIIIGTHALLQKGVKFDDVGLVIIDEQHRFGVAQREALQEQVASSKGQGNLDTKPSLLATRYFYPHFLSMTATPIPRTLHLALFGDLDISIIKEKPADRKEIKTRFVEPQNREKAYEFIRTQIRAGRQAFIICPLIESSEVQVASSKELFEEERKSVKAEYEKLKNIFPEFNIAMMHGRLKAKEKDAVMAEFSAGRAQILVSTSVVEVGVDIPNASVMLIEDAERFGLAQIHQFRGRVGRAEHQSFCFLFSSSLGERVLHRLRSLEAVSDGFELAEIDLETRGPGSIFGIEQSGLLDLKMASLSDRILIEEASRAAKEVAPEIEKYPNLKAKLSEFETSKHLE